MTPKNDLIVKRLRSKHSMEATEPKNQKLVGSAVMTVDRCTSAPLVRTLTEVKISSAGLEGKVEIREISCKSTDMSSTYFCRRQSFTFSIKGLPDSEAAVISRS